MVAPAPARPRTRLATVRAWMRPYAPALRIAGFVAAVGIVVWMGVRAAGEVEPDELAWGWLAAALPAVALWWLLLANGWALLVEGRTTRRDVSVWCRTQALRFLPGGIWAPASRATVVHGSMAEKIAAVAGENLLALGAAVSLGSIAMAIAGPIWWIGLAPALIAPVLAARVLDGRIRVTPRRALQGAVNYLLAFLAYAVGAVLVQVAVSGAVDVPLVAGAALLAWAAGLVVVIAPSGIGVRELVYVELMASSLPAAELAAGAVALRLVSILAELGVLLVAGRPTPPAADAAAAT
ncbi:MAG TPA: hypothetical protein VE526_13460 [Solirubrobacteraceae bacterium]|nr:hypothetical protein [Solirubrobacteraceae bacterium]